MAKEKVLVTGGLGFIGSHTVVELIAAGYEVVIADDLSNAQLFILDHIEKIAGTRPVFYQSDVSIKEEVERIFLGQENIKVVIHFAAFKAVGESVQQPLKYFRNNLFSLINILEVMEKYSCLHMVFSSSATVYGEADQLPVKETAPFKKALSAYGSTKQMGEDILEKVCAASAINGIALRYFNPVGAHASALLGELPIGVPNNLMPFITQVAAGKRESLTVFGNDYDTPDGTCIRDYIHVVDLAKAHVKSCERLLQGRPEEKYEAYNIATGKGYSVLEIIEAFEKFNALKLNYTIGPKRTGDAPAMFADAGYAEKKLGWTAHLGLKDMVTSAWQWEQKLGTLIKDV
jgi:UDP-glucose 4-epimerase